MTLRLGTRGSPLALKQAEQVQRALAPSTDAQLVVIKSEGDLDLTSPLDRPEQAGVFTSALTRAIQSDEVDAAVHSLKDLPLQSPPGIVLSAILKRDDPADLLLVRTAASDDARPMKLQAGSRVGTSAPRRQTQLLHADPSLVPIDIRGNIKTRLSLLEHGMVDGLLMAAAALNRLRPMLPEDVQVHRLDPVRFPPAPGQAAIAVQARAGSPAALTVAPLDDPVTREAVMLERQILAKLGGGCGLPLGAHAWRGSDLEWNLSATLTGEDWREHASPRMSFARLSAPESAPLCVEGLACLQEKPRRPMVGSAADPTRILLTTFDTSALARYAAPLAKIGWRPFAWPLVTSEPTRAPAPNVPDGLFWVALTSARAVPFVEWLVRRHDGGWRSFRIAANGPATAFALRKQGLPVHLVSQKGTGRSLADAIAAFPGDRVPVVWPAAERPAGDLRDGLVQHGFELHHWPVYRTRSRQPAPGLPVTPPVDAFLVTSPSNVHALVERKIGTQSARRWIAIGTTTATTMQRAGYPVDAILDQPSPMGVVQLLADGDHSDGDRELPDPGGTRASRVLDWEED